MFSLEMHYLILQEQRKDHLCAMENQRLLQGAKLQRTANFKSYSKIIYWLGTQMTIWGSKLQRYGSVSISTNIVSPTQ